jgi:hypothetical protein
MARCIQCGKDLGTKVSTFRPSPVGRVPFCLDFRCPDAWEAKTLAGEYTIQAVIRDLKVSIYGPDGGSDLSNPNVTPIIEVAIDFYTFSEKFSKDVTRKTHKFIWKGVIPQEFATAINYLEMNKKVPEILAAVGGVKCHQNETSSESSS